MNARDNLEAVTGAEAEAIDFTREGVIASIINMDSMNHTPNNSMMVMDNSIGEHVTDSMGGNLVSVPITFMDKDNVGIIDSLNNETLKSHVGPHVRVKASRQAVYTRGNEKKEP